MRKKAAISILRGLCTAAALWSLAAPEPASAGNVNLEWRTSASNIRIGETVDIGLYAVSDNELNQTFSGLTVIVAWDPNVLELVSHINNGFVWVGLSGFNADGCVDQLNLDCCCPEGGGACCDPPYSGLPENDGDARYDAAHIGTPPEATPEGLLVTTMVFSAVGPAATTNIWIPATAGEHTKTVVLNGPADQPTGTLGTLALSVAACGTRGDFDADCHVDLEIDYFEFSACLTGPVTGLLPIGCDPADFDGDGTADLHDIAAFQREFTGPFTEQ